MDDRTQKSIAQMKEMGIVVDELNELANTYLIENTEGKKKRNVIRGVLEHKYEFFQGQPIERRINNIEPTFYSLTPKRKKPVAETTARNTLLKAKNSPRDIFTYDTDSKFSKPSSRAAELTDELTGDSRSNFTASKKLILKLICKRTIARARNKTDYINLRAESTWSSQNLEHPEQFRIYQSTFVK